ncbi:hypothetical protein GLAREA_01092 [Glarea lozoyensis ATCC 20868]|uniref:2EXR domain-containing protein n=1 Tax=Glarea lozoyensis (strain ATCC 20868 / MF5171) TaxID=1116229 RepID=S3CU45_GLAL2|nr:uncharacterized protein GLAREA_01092 [Glarea lozoyensis ATCC 20868]EPE29932.1 hypothetical protein GLAREA_01092 [Glarea lozoyensis ATCC 20868]
MTEHTISVVDPSPASLEKANPSIAPSTETTPTTPLKEFHLFPKLIPELRLRVWHFICHEPGTVYMDYIFQPDVPASLCKYPICRNKTSVPPPVFHINKESRTEALRIFRVFIPQQKLQQHANIAQQTVYFNPHVDTIVVRETYVSFFTRLVLNSLSKNVLVMIRFLEFKSVSVNDEWWLSRELLYSGIREKEFTPHDSLVSCFVSLTNIETLAIVVLSMVGR